MSNNKLTDRQLEVWIDDANSVLNDGGATADETSAASTILALCEELQERRKADSAEPVAYWRYAFRADGFCYADGINSKKHHDANPLSQLSDGDYWRVTPLYTAPPAPVVPENCVTAEHRRVIEMLLNVCLAAFELADDSCQQDVDGEECHVVPDDAFQKLSEALDEIENTLPTEDVDRPDVFLSWSAMPRAALKSILQAGNSPVIGIDLASEPDRSVEVRYLAPPGYVMVPKEPTNEMLNAWLSEIANWRGHVAGYKAMLAAAPLQAEEPAQKK